MHVVTVLLAEVDIRKFETSAFSISVNFDPQPLYILSIARAKLGIEMISEFGAMQSVPNSHRYKGEPGFNSSSRTESKSRSRSLRAESLFLDKTFMNSVRM